MTVTSQASFPVANDFVYYNDTIIPDSSQNTSKESIDQYHQRIQSQGFDISSCMCESCRSSKLKNSQGPHDSSRKFLWRSILILLVIVSVIGIFLIVNIFNFLLSQDWSFEL